VLSTASFSFSCDGQHAPHFNCGAREAGAACEETCSSFPEAKRKQAAAIRKTVTAVAQIRKKAAAPRKRVRLPDTSADEDVDEELS
jgi:hypothetical protein